jgi:hypothetical protein
MTFGVAQQFLAREGLTPRDLRDPGEILYTGGPGAFKAASQSNATVQSALAQAGLNLQGRLALEEMGLDYNRELNDRIAAENRRTALLNLSTGLGGTRKAGDTLSQMGISLPGMDPIKIANQYADWVQYFGDLSQNTRNQVGVATRGTGLMTKQAIEGLANTK